jgi:hypothetical protein
LRYQKTTSKAEIEMELEDFSNPSREIIHHAKVK